MCWPTTLVTWALQRNLTYLYTPAEVLAPEGEALRSGQARFRLGGMVEEGSLIRGEGTTVSFSVTDGGDRVQVIFTGVLPDLFAVNSGMIGTGQMVDGVFVANEILAKHDEDYMPRELADSLEQHSYQAPNS